MPLFSSTADGWPYIGGSQNASLIDDYALELATKLDVAVPFAFATGTATVAGTLAAGASANVAITFPSGRFTVAPICTVSMNNAPSGTSLLIARIINATTTGATIYVYNAASSSQTFTGLSLGWMAIQANTGSASS